eukprot:3040762-Heterocapsa_arctica.AAC.1
MVERRCKAEDTLKAQREDNRRVYALSRAGYENNIMIMNVVRQQENTIGLSEVARLSEQIRNHAI